MTAMTDAQQIAAGVFYTQAELAAKPRLGRMVTAAPARRDPNSRPASAEAQALVKTPGACAYCWEPGDTRSPLAGHGQGPMHSECQSAWVTERGQRS